MAGIFISYRRSDSADVAGRIYDRLVRDFSRETVFKDVDSIPLSVPFPSFIRSQLERADVVLVLIGPSWLECRNAAGNRRLDDPEDHVRIEIETALDLGVPTVPIMVSGAWIPHPSQLPKSLKPLADKNGQEVRPDPDFHRDVDRLARRLRPLVQAGPSVAHPYLSRDSLKEVIASAQDWYNEIIQTSAKLNAETSPETRDAVQFVYVNTRSFLPRLLSFRKLLSSSGDTATLAAAIDRFVDLVTYTANDESVFQAMTRCLPLSFRRDDSLPNTLVTDAHGLTELDNALQQVSDAVTLLLASREDNSDHA